MNFIRPLAGTRLSLSAIGLGTVKLGRNQGVKYPTAFSIPDDNEVKNLFSVAQELGINYLDTAPAYGNSEERLGKLLENRHDWVISTKVGEEFDGHQSRFDFSADHTRYSIERSLKRLNSDFLDIVLIHSDGNDESILNDTDCLETLRKCQSEGKIRAIGMSTKTTEGSLIAVRQTDLLMITWNLDQKDQKVVDYASKHDKGVLVKKGLLGGHLQGRERDPVLESMQCIFDQPGIGSMVVGTINPVHLLHNVNMAKKVLRSL